jgi:hypothetical protein
MSQDIFSGGCLMMGCAGYPLGRGASEFEVVIWGRMQFFWGELLWQLDCVGFHSGAFGNCQILGDLWVNLHGSSSRGDFCSII